MRPKDWNEYYNQGREEAENHQQCTPPHPGGSLSMFGSNSPEEVQTRFDENRAYNKGYWDARDNVKETSDPPEDSSEEE
jgi:hypothetical protein